MSILRHLNKHHGWYDGKRTPFGGGGSPSGGGGTTTSQANQYSNISPWASPYVSAYLNAGQQQVFNTTPGVNGAAPTINGVNPYSAYGQNGAGMSPDRKSVV